MQGGTSSPLPEPPSLSGTLGGPSVHPFGAGGDPGAHRDHGLTRSCEAHSYPRPLPLEMQGGTSSPLPEPPSLSGTLGGPSVHPFGAGGDRCAHRDHGLTRSCEAHSYPCTSPLKCKGGLRPPFRTPLLYLGLGGALRP